MKILITILSILLIGCEEKVKTETDETKKDSIPSVTPGSPDTSRTPGADTVISQPYANTRFRNVTVQRIGDSTFRVRGQGQIFEANFGWVIEDGHEELKNGYQMTDAGAPEWGNFDFTVTASKKRPNSTLHLVIFETSAKDGSRVYELPIALY